MEYDESKETIENVDYLIEAAALLPNETYAHKLLKSYFLTKSRKLLQSCGTQQRTLFNDEEFCRKCTSPWSYTNYSMNIKSIKMTKCRATKIIRTLDNKSYPKRHRSAKRLSKMANNIITIQCDLCKNRKEIVLRKKSSVSRSEQIQPEITPEPIAEKRMKEAVVTYDTTDSASKKPKLKKAKTAGLLFTINKEDKQLQKVTEAKTAVFKSFAKMAKDKSKLSLGGRKKAKSKMSPSHVLKKPSILQLANALKKKNSEPTTAADKLKKMLN